MDKKSLLKEALRQKRAALKKAKSTKERVKAPLQRLRQLKEDIEAFFGVDPPSRLPKGSSFGGGSVSPNIPKHIEEELSGIFIVEDVVGSEHRMVRFYPFIRGDKEVARISLPLKEKVINDDGDEVTFNKGDLLMVSYLKDIDPKNKVGFHFANIVANTPESKTQYQLALHMIGMGEKPCMGDNSFLIVDGGFRKV